MTAAKLLNALLRVPLTAAHGVLKAHWFVTRPTTFGAHALAMTASGRIVLVRLRYAGGWRLPGGGRKEAETSEQAVLRELREEIGLVGFGQVERVCDLAERADFKRDMASLFIVRDVRYRPPRWSWEIESVMEADLDDLPADLSPRAAKWLEAVIPNL